MPTAGSGHADEPAAVADEAPVMLVALLQLAHSGERAAAYAYSGHWRSVRQAEDRATIKRIEAEEWDHRSRVGRMLAALDAQPARARERELKMMVIGRAVALLCFVSGRFVPMYGAGMIERRNVHEYVEAARLARVSAHPEFVDELLEMARVEWDHEHYFRSQVSGRWQLRLLPLWPALGLRHELGATVALDSLD